MGINIPGESPCIYDKGLISIHFSAVCSCYYSLTLIKNDNRARKKKYQFKLAALR